MVSEKTKTRASNVGLLAHSPGNVYPDTPYIRSYRLGYGAQAANSLDNSFRDYIVDAKRCIYES